MYADVFFFSPDVRCLWTTMTWLLRVHSHSWMLLSDDWWGGWKSRLAGWLAGWLFFHRETHKVLLETLFLDVCNCSLSSARGRNVFSFTLYGLCLRWGRVDTALLCLDCVSSKNMLFLLVADQCLVLWFFGRSKLLRHLSGISFRLFLSGPQDSLRKTATSSGILHWIRVSSAFLGRGVDWSHSLSMLPFSAGGILPCKNGFCSNSWDFFSVHMTEPKSKLLLDTTSSQGNGK